MRRSPKETTDSARKISRRAMLLGGVQLGFVGLLGLRMRYMQVDQADEFRLLAEENRVNIRLIPPKRGEIFDREGRIIAANEPSYRITMVREDAGNVEDVIARLSTLVELDEDDLNRALTEMNRSAPVSAHHRGRSGGLAGHQPRCRQCPRPARCHTRGRVDPQLSLS